jgi:hypothetical protein
LNGFGGLIETLNFYYLLKNFSLPYIYILFFNSGILQVYSSKISPSFVTKKQSAYFWKAIAYEAT